MATGRATETGTPGSDTPGSDTRLEQPSMGSRLARRRMKPERAIKEQNGEGFVSK